MYNRAVELLVETEPPLSVTGEPGPYRLEDYLATPEEWRGELLWGHLVVSPSPFRRHQHVLMALYDRLRPFARAAGHELLVAPADVVLDRRSVVQPDLLLVHASRREILRIRVDGAPDLAVEILSESSGRRDRLVKLALYARAGVPEYWIVDPERRTIDFLALEGDAYRVLLPVDGRFESVRFPGLVIELEPLWAEVERSLAGQPAG